MVTPRAEVKGALALQLGGTKEAVKLWKEAPADQKSSERNDIYEIYWVTQMIFMVWSIVEIQWRSANSVLNLMNPWVMPLMTQKNGQNLGLAKLDRWVVLKNYRGQDCRRSFYPGLAISYFWLKYIWTTERYTAENHLEFLERRKRAQGHRDSKVSKEKPVWEFLIQRHTLW